MNKHRREVVSILVTLGIITISVFIVHKFILPLLWAAIIAIATFPIYKSWKRLWGRYDFLAALSLTIIVSIIIAVPISWLISLLVKETHSLVLFLLLVNKSGQPTPDWVINIPLVGQHLGQLWQQYLGKPGSLNGLITNLHMTLSPASYALKQIGLSIAHRGVILVFTLLCLFFMYRDGEKLSAQINRIGQYCMGDRWQSYSARVPSAIRSTVNGTIFVALGVGILMGTSYSFAQIQAPVLLGFTTAVLAMIPFGAPVVFITISLVLLAQGFLISGFLILAWGTLVMFIADHVAKPILIGNSTRLPFLAVLFGILGGVETLGLIGLFLGPIIMVLFMTLWNEPQTAVSVVRETIPDEEPAPVLE
jgi:predicted PurR-regulated permease PerM